MCACVCIFGPARGEYIPNRGGLGEVNIAYVCEGYVLVC